MNLPELLAPAGSFEKMQYAIAYGADAVYIGLPRFSLRARENDFDEEATARALAYAHHLGKKVYLTMNIYPHNRKVQPFLDQLGRVAALKPDGLIIADPGMIMLTRERHPELTIHLSTQANTINWPSVKFWQKLGVRRIILSRELGMDEIREIRQQVPDVELEIFIHGAICIAYSGRCLLSNYFNHRDANQGACTNACRWEYKLHQLLPAGSDVSETPANLFLEESERPGQLMPVYEDEHGAYIMNAKDLSTITILKELMSLGVDSFKIEGRSKSLYYVSMITRAYRRVMKTIAAGSPVPAGMLDEVYAVTNRDYVTGFLERNPLHEGLKYDDRVPVRQNRIFCGVIDQWNAMDQTAILRVRNRFDAGDLLEICSPEGITAFQVGEIWDAHGKAIISAHGGGPDIRLRLPLAPQPFALLRKIV
jgi:putative protease